MSRYACLAALVAALCLVATAAGQNATDCDRSVKNCEACRYQFFRGTTTKAICTKCKAGYVSKASGRACYCAPGYYTTNATNVAGSVGFTCIACGNGTFCPGSKITAASSTARTPCGAHKITTTSYATSELECVVLPGYGWAAGEGSAQCLAGTYNPGFNARKCTPCPGGLTTSADGATSSQDCQAGIGFYYLRGKAVACARGTYKVAIGNTDCTSCPTGVSTPKDTVSASVAINCSVLLPGYEIVPGLSIGSTNATECPVNTYRDVESALDAAGVAAVGVNCTACPDGLVTLPNTTRATSLDACVTPPGWGWTTVGASTAAGKAIICANGTFNPGYNRQPCVACGDGLLTDAPGATTADACFTPAGWGNAKNGTGAYTATICPAGTYGRGNNTYGLVDVECTKCLDHSTTNSSGATNQSQCLVEPGYGWADGQVLQCEYGYYNEGYNQRLCTYCGDGYNTSATAAAHAGELGSNASSTCQIDFGYFNGTSNGVEACLRGYYKDVLGQAACSQCPMGVSTTKAAAAVAISDCDTCKPGFGVLAGTQIANLSAPNCTMCPSGKYSSGFKAGGQACDVCPKPTDFDGKMVSRPGIFTPEDCYGEFTTSNNTFDNKQAWDIIEMDASALFLQNTTTSLVTCQDGCSASVNCQYFAFYNTGAPDGDGLNKCYYRLAGAIAPISIADIGNWDTPTAPLVAFEIREGQYAVYKAVASEVIGVTLDGTAGHGLATAKAACDANAECVGIHGTSTGWTTFAATKREDVIGKIRVVGENIQAWVNLPTGL